MKIIHVVLLASVKYILTLPYAMIIGLEYKQALIAVLIGGIGGFLFFYYLSKRAIQIYHKIRPYIYTLIPRQQKTENWKFVQDNTNQQKKRRKIFSKRNRLIARFRKTYGFWGIIVTTPVFLTIPVGAFLANKYYSRRRFLVLYMILSIIGWAGVLSGFIHLFPRIFF
ncbi:hypothetical protein [Maribellus maritimus]|uniref:hypothetical protein n=1 Tax=Maribellus maritimus TaxID=2870838 RepID=UPI001EEC23E3|nr:hypothetical protein [Maribellus maritimus]MCG6190121.1 hypothetical protein [Maribellus maritimus]